VSPSVISSNNDLLHLQRIGRSDGRFFLFLAAQTSPVKGPERNTIILPSVKLKMERHPVSDTPHCKEPPKI